MRYIKDLKSYFYASCVGFLIISNLALTENRFVQCSVAWYVQYITLGGEVPGREGMFVGVVTAAHNH